MEKHPQTKVWYEDQIMNVTLLGDDGEKEEKEIPYVVFTRRYDKILAEVISETKDNDGEIFFKLKTIYDGKEYTINKKFVN